MRKFWVGSFVLLAIAIVLYFILFSKSNSNSKGNVSRSKLIKIKQGLKKKCSAGEDGACFSVSNFEKDKGGENLFNHIQGYLEEEKLNFKKSSLNNKRKFWKTIKRPNCKTPDIYRYLIDAPTKANLAVLIGCDYKKKKKWWKSFMSKAVATGSGGIGANGKAKVTSKFSAENGFDQNIKKAIYDLYDELNTTISGGGGGGGAYANSKPTKKQEESMAKMVHLSDFVMDTYMHGEPSDLDSSAPVEDNKFLMPIGASSMISPYYDSLLKKKDANKESKVTYVPPAIIVPFIVKEDKGNKAVTALYNKHDQVKSEPIIPKAEVINTIMLVKPSPQIRAHITKKESRKKTDPCGDELSSLEGGYQACTATLCNGVEKFQSMMQQISGRVLKHADCQHQQRSSLVSDNSHSLHTLMCHYHFQGEHKAISNFLNKRVKICGDISFTFLGKWILRYGDDHLVEQIAPEKVAQLERDTSGVVGGDEVDDRGRPIKTRKGKKKFSFKFRQCRGTGEAVDHRQICSLIP